MSERQRRRDHKKQSINAIHHVVGNKKTTARSRELIHTIPDPEVTALGSFVYNIAVVKFGKLLPDKTYTMENGSYVSVKYTLEIFFTSTRNENGRK